MSTHVHDPFAPEPQSTALQRIENNITPIPRKIVTEPQGSGHASGSGEPIVVHFNGHFNGAFIIPNNMQQQAPPESDAQIAARRAMAKRSSRSFASRIRSRKMEVVGRTAKPGITVDTSVARHRGNAPHQVYPQDSQDRSGGSIRKSSWFGLSRSGTKVKGLGIMKGTPQPGGHETSPVKDPKTTESLTAGSKSWQEISPWDRPIPIGISIPSDSVPDFSPYQSTRQRADSDATLATPSIIITPAEAIKSVWSPDTASDYTPARGSSVYSHATYMQHYPSHIPPVPALPADVHKLPGSQNHQYHSRSDTLDSSGTAFEEEDDERRKDRIMSTGTMFEEDYTPLREKDGQTGLTVDTATLPTPRRSQGWWNVITTPFVLSRSNSLWTQGGAPAQKTPEMPVIPAEYGVRRESPSSPVTYIWSATEKSPSEMGDQPPQPPAMPAIHVASGMESQERSANVQSNHDSPAFGVKPAIKNQVQSNTNGQGMGRGASSPPVESLARNQQVDNMSAKTTSPSLSTKGNEPAVSAPLMAAILPRSQANEPAGPINVNIELQDRRPAANAQTPSLRSASALPPQAIHVHTGPSPPGNVNSTTQRDHVTMQPLPVFPPPPTSAQNGVRASFDSLSRASSPGPKAQASETNPNKGRLTVTNMLSRFALCRRKKDVHGDKKKKQKRSRCFLCCGCCIIIFVLLAIIIPLVVVFTKKHNRGVQDAGPGQGPPSQWLNLTGYPPIPTGILTIAQPEASEEQSGCVSPATIWSCALPKEQQPNVSPNKPDQPNFKFEITFQNGTVADPTKTVPVKRAVNPVSAGAFIRAQLLRIRAAPAPSPAPPSVDERRFLGQTTDKNSAPFEGEETPFFISVQDPMQAAASRLAKRVDPNDPNNITDLIPPPQLTSDGTAAPANLLPLPAAQPLRLFNRGKPDEYYGFYTYYDRSIFLKNINDSLSLGGNPADTNGGSRRDAATLRCTWSQTRFLVQIWTQSQKSKPLLGTSAVNGTNPQFERPGTFRYPVTVTLDRHGGDFSKKNLFCYRMENDMRILDKPSNKFMYQEDRRFGGNLVNGTQGKVNVTGPIDGGTGGCSCKWQNWLD